MSGKALLMADLKRWTRPHILFSTPFGDYIPNRRQDRMETPMKCPGCGSAPEPVKRQRSEIYVCECGCGWTCLGYDRDQAVRTWNHTIATETLSGKPKNNRNKTTRSE